MVGLIIYLTCKYSMLNFRITLRICLTIRFVIVLFCTDVEYS